MFAEYVALPIVPDSIESRPPPEPDILCRMQSGETTAFELGELSVKSFRQDHDTLTKTRTLLNKGVQGLEEPARSELLRRFSNACIRVQFDPTAVLRRRETVLPTLYKWLVTGDPPAGTLEADALPEAVGRVIQRVRILRPSPCLMIEPDFGIALTPPDLRVFYKKTHATYTSRRNVRSPMELLLHFWFPELGATDAWLLQYAQGIREEMDRSAFKRIWIFDVSKRTTEHALKFVYPLDRKSVV